MSTITARIPDDLNIALTEIAKLKERSKNFLIKKAIQNYILELRDDEEDYKYITDRLNSDKPGISWEQAQREGGLLED